MQGNWGLKSRKPEGLKKDGLVALPSFRSGLSKDTETKSKCSVNTEYTQNKYRKQAPRLGLGVVHIFLDKIYFFDILLLITIPITNKMKRDVSRRNTRQRQVILEELRKVKTHPTADSIFRMVRKRIPAISFGTVYRNLNLLRDQGGILELACGRYSCRYDGSTHNHYHFLCLKCKNVFDIAGPVLDYLDIRVSENSGFTVKYHRIDFYGYCKDCKGQDRREN